jgi:hypothetical protein
VVAKSGTIIGGSSLTGVATTASEHEAVFSVIVNGDGAPAAIRALDDRRHPRRRLNARVVLVPGRRRTARGDLRRSRSEHRDPRP